MTLTKTAVHALVSAILASAACLIYAAIYNNSLAADFSKIINAGSVIGSCILGCVLMGLAYYFGRRWKGEKAIAPLNVLISLLSFASIVGAFGVKLPLDLESPELFPGLVVPMHFFPALAFFAIYPFFKTKTV